jgi:hypothetical protein
MGSDDHPLLSNTLQHLFRSFSSEWPAQRLGLGGVHIGMILGIVGRICVPVTHTLQALSRALC